MDWVESDCIRQADQFAHPMEKYRELLVCAPSITKKSGSTFRELPLAQTLHIRSGAMLATAAKAALKGSPKAAKRAVPHLIAHKVVSTIANAAKKRKRVDINVKPSQDPQSKKAFADTGPDINPLIDGSAIVLD